MANYIDPWGEGLVDYEKTIKDFGLEKFNAKLFPNPNRLMRRGIVFAGRDLKIIAKCPYAIAWFKRHEEYQDIVINVKTKKKL